jgi:hypothetical protein
VKGGPCPLGISSPSPCPFHFLGLSVPCHCHCHCPLVLGLLFLLQLDNVTLLAPASQVHCVASGWFKLGDYCLFSLPESPQIPCGAQVFRLKLPKVPYLTYLSTYLPYHLAFTSARSPHQGRFDGSLFFFFLNLAHLQNSLRTRTHTTSPAHPKKHSHNHLEHANKAAACYLGPPRTCMSLLRGGLRHSPAQSATRPPWRAFTYLKSWPI